MWSTPRAVRIKAWLSSRIFFLGGGKIYCYANFFRYANFSIVFGPNFGGGGTASRPRGAPCGRKPESYASFDRRNVNFDSGILLTRTG